jgi:methionyl-tRNA formyltransferase
LEKLAAGRHPLVAVVSQPDRPRGRGRRVSPSPVAQAAARLGLPLLRPEKVGDAETAAALAAAAPDLGVVVAFGQFLPRRIRELPALGYCINAHASLLPRWRGAAPIAHAILAGDSETGVSLMRVEREMDAGPVAAQRALAIGAEETAGELSARLAVLAAELLAEQIERIARGPIPWTPQDPARVTVAPRLARADAELDWREPAAALARRVRALAPAPGAFTQLAGAGLRILAARALAGPVDRPPGTLRRAGASELRVATGEGWLVPLALQRAGGRVLDVASFLRGHALPDGTRLGGPSLDSRR